MSAATAPVAQVSPETHAEDFLNWLLDNQEGFASRVVLYELLRVLYAKRFCPEHDLKPLPWRSVARELDILPGVDRYEKHVYLDDGRRVKRQVYELPGRDQALDVSTGTCESPPSYHAAA